VKWSRAAARVWRQGLSDLRRECPTDHPAVVRRIKTPDDTYGDCTLRKGKFSIRINRTLPLSLALVFLVHEWAHARAWRLENEKYRHHTAHWGVCYAECWNLIIGED
jgi:hypothetical protein